MAFAVQYETLIVVAQKYVEIDIKFHAAGGSSSLLAIVPRARATWVRFPPPENSFWKFGTFCNFRYWGEDCI